MVCRALPSGWAPEGVLCYQGISLAINIAIQLSTWSRCGAD